MAFHCTSSPLYSLSLNVIIPFLSKDFKLGGFWRYLISDAIDIETLAPEISGQHFQSYRRYERYYSCFISALVLYG
jgi:hypothetical protein